MTFIFSLAFLVLQDVIPFKPADEFEIKLDYHFQSRPLSDHTTVVLNPQTRNSASIGVLPYLKLDIKMLALPGDRTRITIADNHNPRASNKRVSVNSVLTLDLGFTVDMIDRVKPHLYTITFLNAEREPINKIVILIEADGSFLVNGEKRGKF